MGREENREFFFLKIVVNTEREREDRNTTNKMFNFSKSFVTLILFYVFFFVFSLLVIIFFKFNTLKMRFELVHSKLSRVLSVQQSAKLSGKKVLMNKLLTFRWLCWNCVTSILVTFQNRNQIDKEMIRDAVEDFVGQDQRSVSRLQAVI